MSLVRKIIFLLVCFLLLNVFSIYGFDYKEYFENKNNTSLSDDSFTDKIFNVFRDEDEDKPFTFTLVKKDGVLEMSGIFRNESDAQKIADFLTVNREGDYKFEENRVSDENLVENLVTLITPFKDFFADDSQIVVSNNEVTISGVLKDANYKDLLDTLFTRVNLDLKTNIKLPNEVLQEKLAETTEQKDEVVENKNAVEPTVENKTVQELAKEKKIEEIISKVTAPNIKDVQAEINNILKVKKITFERRSSSMTEESKAVVLDISKILKENPTLKVEVAGHTDSRGKDELNKQISQDRANSVKEFLVGLGIDENRIKAVGYGEEFPIAKDDENGLSEINRRVEFNILGE